MPQTPLDQSSQELLDQVQNRLSRYDLAGLRGPQQEIVLRRREVSRAKAAVEEELRRLRKEDVAEPTFATCRRLKLVASVIYHEAMIADLTRQLQLIELAMKELEDPGRANNVARVQTALRSGR